MTNSWFFFISEFKIICIAYFHSKSKTNSQIISPPTLSIIPTNATITLTNSLHTHFQFDLANPLYTQFTILLSCKTRNVTFLWKTLKGKKKIPVRDWKQWRSKVSASRSSTPKQPETGDNCWEIACIECHKLANRNVSFVSILLAVPWSWFPPQQKSQKSSFLQEKTTKIRLTVCNCENWWKFRIPCSK